MKTQLSKFSRDQQFFFDRIQNKKLKTLISESHIFSLLNDKEKMDLLIRASIVHKNPEAEQKLIAIFQEDKAKTKNAFNNTETLTPEEQDQQDAIMEQEYNDTKQAVTKLKKGVLHEEEKQSKTIDEKKIEQLFNKI